MPLRHGRVPAALLAVLCFAGTASALSPPPGETPDPSITDGSAQHALTAARAKWKTAGIHGYNVRIAKSCFCPPSARKARTIKVRGGAPVHPPSDLRDVATVPRMFRYIQHAIDAGVAGLTVDYGKRGVPRRIAVDVSRRIADEEVAYSVDHFQRVH